MVVTNTPHRAPEAPDKLGVRGWLTLITLCGATFLIALDFSIVTVALPEIGRDLNFATAGDLQWVATACLLPTASLLLLFGRVSDLVGRRRLFILGIILFTGLSLIGGLAPNPGVLIAARAGQGVAAAMIGPTAIALMTASFREGPQRTKALAVNGALLSLGFVIGTIGGGLITSGLSWRWTMLIMVFLGAFILLGAVVLLPKDGARIAARLDVPGAILASGGLFAPVYGISTGADAGWTSGSTLGSLIAAAVLIAAFLLVEARHPAPLVSLELLKRPTVKWSFVVGFVTFGMCGGTTVLLSLYMQDVLGYSALATGFGFLAEGATALVAGTIASKLIGSLGTRQTMALGLLVQAVGTGFMVFLPADSNIPLLLVVTSGAMGFGHVLAVVAFITTLTSGLRTDEQGVAGALSQMPQFIGAIGVAGLAAIVTARSAALASTTTAELATLGGLHAATLTAGFVCLVGLLVALTLLRRAAPAPEPAPAA
ncbi:MFS transporter [Streptomyces doebereineriae]|uniref:MFS transporter n=1 Tax=Streptomyces doebereineriae TaxID=3075528 RepID=A0ABU2VIE2_9ACTN|nr:MFS transporter [Streptomyces sp. DSM 41640]MDT0485361.1 MFS transporter [Streptomyces sp. DSM 41640]